MGETRVDLLHLLQDLADAYGGDLHETILTEIIANALDSGATRVRLVTDLSAPALTVIDDGRGSEPDPFAALSPRDRLGHGNEPCLEHEHEQEL